MKFPFCQGEIFSVASKYDITFLDMFIGHINNSVRKTFADVVIGV